MRFPRARSLLPSRALLRDALAIREDALGPEHPDTATALNNLANLFRDQGDYAEARPLFERGPWHPDTAY